jgi:hypothetical protein
MPKRYHLPKLEEAQKGVRAPKRRAPKSCYRGMMTLAKARTGSATVLAVSKKMEQGKEGVKTVGSSLPN